MRSLAYDSLAGIGVCAFAFLTSACSLVLPFGDYSEGRGATGSGAATSSATGVVTSAGAGAGGAGGGCALVGCAPEVLATDQGLPSDIAAGAGMVAWIRSDELVAVSASPSPGEMPEVVPAPAPGPVTEIEFDGQRFVAHGFWDMTHHVERVVLPASTWEEIGFVGDPTSALTSALGVVALTAYGSVYAISTGASDQFIDKWSEPATPNEVVSIAALAVTATSVFVADDEAGVLKRCVIAAAPPQCDDFAATHPRLVAVRASHVVWFDETRGTVAYCPASGCAPSPVELAQPGAGAGVTALTLDGDAAYWVESTTGRVVRCPVAGCPEGPAVLADGLDSPTTMVAAEGALFVVEGGSGKLLKMVLAP